MRNSGVEEKWSRGVAGEWSRQERLLRYSTTPLLSVESRGKLAMALVRFQIESAVQLDVIETAVLGMATIACQRLAHY
jgi:hypothetical protein